MHELVSRNQLKDLDRPPTEEEVREISGIPFSTLVKEAYGQLDRALDDGITPQLIEVLKEQSRRLLVFWRIQQEKYDKVLAEGLVQRFRPGEENENAWFIEGDIKSHNTYDNENQVIAVHLETPEERDVIVFSPLQSGPRLSCWPKRSKKGQRMPSFEVFYSRPLIARIDKKERISDPASEKEFYVGRNSRIDFIESFRTIPLV